jgi:acyl dehydratase
MAESIGTVHLGKLAEHVGTWLGVSDWVLVDQPMIDAFADATGDHQ